MKGAITKKKVKLTQKQKDTFKKFDGGQLTLFDHDKSICFTDRRLNEVKINRPTFEKFKLLKLIKGSRSRVFKGYDYKLTHKGIRLILELTKTF